MRITYRAANVDILADATLPEHFQGHDYSHGVDKLGRPVLISHFGNMDTEEVFKDVDAFVKYRVHVMENAVKRLAPFGRVFHILKIA